MKIVEVKDRRAFSDQLRDGRQGRWKLEILESASDPTSAVGLGDPRRQVRESGVSLARRGQCAAQSEACLAHVERYGACTSIAWFSDVAPRPTNIDARYP